MPKKFLIVLSLLFFVACNKVNNNNNTPSTPINNLISTAYTPQNVLVGSDSNKFVFNLSTTNNNGNNNSKVNSASASNYQVKISEAITYQGVKYPANTTFNITTNSNGQVVFYYNPPANLNNTTKQINFTFTNTTQNITQTISASVNIQTGFVINPYANNYNTTTSDTGAFILNIISDGITPRSYVYTIPTTDSIYDYQKQRLLNLNNPYDSLTSKSSVSQIAFNLGLITKLVNSNRVLTISVNDANNGNINRTATIAFNVALGNWGFSISASTVTPNITINDTGTINLRIKSDGSVARTYVLYPAIADSILYNNTLYNNGKAINLFTSATIDTTINLGFITKIAGNRTVNLVVKDLSNASQSASVRFVVQTNISTFFTATITRSVLTPGPNWINPSTGSSNSSNQAFMQSGILFALAINTQNNPAQGPFFITVTSNNGDTLYQVHNLPIILPPRFNFSKNDTLMPGKKVQISNDRVGYNNDTLAYLAKKITGDISMNVTISNSQGYSINIPINFTVGSSFKASITPFSTNPPTLTPGNPQTDSAYFILSVDTSIRPAGIGTSPFYAKVTSTNGDTLYRIYINSSGVRQYDALLPNAVKTILFDNSNNYKDTLLYVARQSYGSGGKISITVQIYNNNTFGEISNQTISLQTTTLPFLSLSCLPNKPKFYPESSIFPLESFYCFVTHIKQNTVILNQS